MKILVCVKQVPDMESRFKPAADGLWFDDCGCFSGDLMPCGSYSGYCEPGYRARISKDGDKMEILGIVPEKPLPDGTWETCGRCKKQWPHNLDKCPHCGNEVVF